MEIVEINTPFPRTPIFRFLFPKRRFQCKDEFEIELQVGGMVLSKITDKDIFEYGEYMCFPFFDIDPAQNNGETMFRADLLYRHEIKLVYEEPGFPCSKVVFNDYYVETTTPVQHHTITDDVRCVLYTPDCGNHPFFVGYHMGMISTYYLMELSTPEKRGHLATRQGILQLEGDYIRVWETEETLGSKRYMVNFGGTSQPTIMRYATNNDIVSIHCEAYHRYWETLVLPPKKRDELFEVLYVLGDEPKRCVLDYPPVVSGVFPVE